MPTVDLRCPVGPKKLLAKMVTDGNRPHIVSGNLVELNCDFCKQSRRRQGQQVNRVLHRFNLAGELVEDVIQ